MLKKYSLILGITAVFITGFVCLGHGAEQNITKEPDVTETSGLDKIRALNNDVSNNIITVTGRLSQDKRVAAGSIFITCKDSKTYIVLGSFVDKLKQVFLDLGEKNVVTVSGIFDGKHEIICSNQYGFDSANNPIADSRCIRAYHIDVTAITENKASPEEFPAPERYSEEENRVKDALASSGKGLLKPPGLTQRAIRKVIVTAVNLRSVIKTVEIKFKDKDGQTIKDTLIISPETVFVRGGTDKLTEGKSQPASITELKPNQEISVIYTIDYSQVPPRSTAEAVGIIAKQ